jgi:hypothetical protein
MPGWAACRIQQWESSAEQAMEEVSDIVVGVLVLVLGLIGLKMASGALDDEIYVFGLSMALFAVLFEFGLIRRYFDRQEAAARVQAGTHG